MKLERLSDLLEIDTDSMKAAENKRLLTRVKQLIKAEGKVSEKADEVAEEFPYTGASVVGNKFVELKFDLKTKKARVVNVEIDPRDNKKHNYMAGAAAIRKVQELVKQQKTMGYDEE